MNYLESPGMLGCTPTCGCSSTAPTTNGLIGVASTVVVQETPAEALKNRVIIPVLIVLGMAGVGAGLAYLITRND